MFTFRERRRAPVSLLGSLRGPQCLLLRRIGIPTFRHLDRGHVINMTRSISHGLPNVLPTRTVLVRRGPRRFNSYR